MGPEFVRDDHMMRVDGDVFEIFDVQYHARRIPLVWLAVRAEALRKNRVVISDRAAGRGVRMEAIVSRRRGFRAFRNSRR